MGRLSDRESAFAVEVERQKLGVGLLDDGTHEDGHVQKEQRLPNGTQGFEVEFTSLAARYAGRVMSRKRVVAIPGMAAHTTFSKPKRLTIAVRTVGPRAQPKVPALMKTAIQRPCEVLTEAVAQAGLAVEGRDTRTAQDDEEQRPTKVGAMPSAVMKIPAVAGARAVKRRERNRSERIP